MRRLILCVAGLVFGCSKSPATSFGTSSGSTSSSSSSSSGDVYLCVPGQQIACACPGGAMGVQVCAADGQSYGGCMECSGGAGGSGGTGEASSSSSTSSSSSGMGGVGGVGGSAGAGGQGGAPVACSDVTSCPGEDTVCAWRTCIESTCGWAYAAFGAPAADNVDGDCVRPHCDGKGGGVSFFDASDPTNDSNVCTVDTCEPNGTTTHPAIQVKTLCSDNGGRICYKGTCQLFAPVYCQTAMGTFMGCDGVMHDYDMIVGGTEPINAPVCPGTGTSWNYCTPGDDCAYWMGNTIIPGTCIEP